MSIKDFKDKKIHSTKGWQLEIEESAQLLKMHGVLCMVNPKGERLYVRPVSHKGNFIELKPLSLKELSELNIEIQESCLNFDFDVEVSESDTETPVEKETNRAYEEAKKTNSFNLLDPEQARKARQLAEAAVKIAEQKSPDELQAENEDLRLKLELVAERELERKLNNLQITDPELRAKFKNNPSQLLGYELAMKERFIEKGEVPSGSAPLNDRQIGASAKGYETHEEMIKDLRNRAKNGDSNAEIILNQLYKKVVSGIRERKSAELPFPTQSEPIGDVNAKAIEIPITAPEMNDSELERWGVKTKAWADRERNKALRGEQ